MMVVWAIDNPRSAIISTRSPKAELEAQIPPHAQDNDLAIKVAPLEQLLQPQEPSHRAALKQPDRPDDRGLGKLHQSRVEIVEEFAEGAQLFLGQLGYTNVRIRTGDGSRGWLEHAPFDKIMVTAAAEEIPPALLEQLQPTGRLVMPLGHSEAQQLTMMERNAEGTVHSRAVMPVRFTQLEIVN